MLFFPLPFVRNKENGNIETRIPIGYEPSNYKTCLYSAGCKEVIAVTKPYSEALFEMNLQELRILLSIISTPILTFLIPFVIFNAEIWQCISSEFSNHACTAVTFIFPTCKNIVEYVYEISCWLKHTWISIKNCKYIWYLQMSYQQKEETGSQREKLFHCEELLK